ncbi:NADPH:quinone reductase [Roseococcus sp. SYP-B2431]|uniref:NADPH:quinone reductase n=1 Tax=Roseococcus sp. SYP-B2431 TaxID=2496640 RepID=UPI00103D01A3|nr:NADPH:quinone reductase [Roseococcus sp. SYP-B2431]TCH98559.1 NADPH:quinone reductase [Roseococcus sp. SYP-B2431]
MKAVWYERNGPARDVLVHGEMPTPEPAAGEVLVRVHASGVNPSDWKTRGGSRPMAAARVIPHSDGAGVIEKLGAGVDAARLGQRVWIWNAQWKRPFGTAAEYVALPAAQAGAMPDSLSFEAGACLGIPALTALRAVTTDGGVAGQSVLVAGGAGAVGHYAIQFAKRLGAAQVLATVSSEAKAEQARGAGADAAIDYRREDVAARVRELTGGRGVDRVVEVDLSGNVGLLPAVLAPDGICVAYGSAEREVGVNFGPMILGGFAIRFFIVYELAAGPRAECEALLARFLAEGGLQHKVAVTMPLSECAAAHDLVQAGTVMGNVVLTVP